MRTAHQEAATNSPVRPEQGGHPQARRKSTKNDSDAILTAWLSIIRDNRNNALTFG